jgi:hypothetical protein
MRQSHGQKFEELKQVCLHMIVEGIELAIIPFGGVA